MNKWFLLNEFLEDLDEESSTSSGQNVHSFDAGNFNINMVKYIYVSYLCIMESLKIIIDLLSYTGTNLNLDINDSNFTLPIKNINFYNFKEFMYNYGTFALGSLPPKMSTVLYIFRKICRKSLQ